MKGIVFNILLLAISIFISCGDDDCGKEDKPNLVIPPTVNIPNPYNGIVGTYVNEWYWLERFGSIQPCMDCFGNIFFNGFGYPIMCDGWNNQHGYFYYGQCIPPLVPGDSLVIYKYIFNVAPPDNPLCKYLVAKPNTTKIIVRDSKQNVISSQEKKLPEIEPGGFAVFQYYVIYGELGIERIEVITDYFNEISEANENDNSDIKTGIKFN